MCLDGWVSLIRFSGNKKPFVCEYTHKQTDRRITFITQERSCPVYSLMTLSDRKDRMSMYNGLEVRVPFCDYRIAEYLYGVPWEFKDYRHYEKGLLREAMKDYLPHDILWRKKSPYPKTHHPAYLAAVSQLLERLVWDTSAPLWQIVRRDKAATLLNTANNPQPWYGQLMTTPQTIAYLLQINYWLQTYNIRIVS